MSETHILTAKGNKVVRSEEPGYFIFHSIQSAYNVVIILKHVWKGEYG